MLGIAWDGSHKFKVVLTYSLEIYLSKKYQLWLSDILGMLKLTQARLKSKFLLVTPLLIILFINHLTGKAMMQKGKTLTYRNKNSLQRSCFCEKYCFHF